MHEWPLCARDVGLSGERAVCGESRLGGRWRSGPVPVGIMLTWAGMGAPGPTRAPRVWSRPDGAPECRLGMAAVHSSLALCRGAACPPGPSWGWGQMACRLQGAERRQAEPRVPAEVRALGKLRGPARAGEEAPDVRSTQSL